MWLCKWPSSVILQRMPVPQRCRDPAEAENPRSCLFVDSPIWITKLAPNVYVSFARKYSPAERIGSIASRTPAHSESPNDESSCATRQCRLGHHRHEIPIAQAVGDASADAQLDDLGIEPAPSVSEISDYWLGDLASRERGNCTMSTVGLWRPWPPRLHGIAR
jgi:hypothetical protein